MALKFADSVAIAACNTIVDAIDLGSGQQTLVLYDGTRPANPSVAVTTQVVLATFNLPDPAFGNAAAVSGGAAASGNPVTEVNAVASSNASWFRVYDGNGAAHHDGDVSNTAGSGDAKLSNVALVTGVGVSVVSMTYTQPKGW